MRRLGIFEFGFLISGGKRMTILQPVARTRANRGLTLDQVWVAAALILLALRPLLTPIPPHDFWWHMATGRAIVEQGAIPATDSFSFTRAGEPFFNQSWLAQLLMYALYSAGGIALVLLVQSLVITLAYGLLLRLCALWSGRLRLSVALLLLTTMPLSFDNWTVRPQTYAFPLFVAVLTILTEYRLGRSRRLWSLPLLMALWVNIHGSFVLGLALIGITLVGEWLQQLRAPAASRSPVLSRTYLGWGVATALATLLNPQGIGVIAYVRNLLGSNQVTSLVTEWAPPSIRDIGGMIFFLFVIVTMLALIYGRRRPGLTDMLLLLAFLWLALGAVRNIVWFGFVATPLLVVQAGSLLPDARGRSSAGSPVLNAILVGVLLLLLGIGLPWVKPVVLPPSVGALLAEDTPVAAVRFIEQQPDRPQRLFHAMGYGSYLIWAAPEQKVFIDPRIELYPFDQWRDYINLGQANNVAELLDKYRIDSLLLSRAEQEALIDAVRQEPGWQQRYADDRSVYFQRSAP
jgi:hypothetical protein